MQHRPDGSATQRPAWWPRVLLLLGTLVFCVGALEVGLRLAGSESGYRGDDLMIVPSDNPRLIYEFRPSHRVVQRGIVVRTNSAGFRDREFATTKDAKTYRILCVGDSVTMGLGVAEDEAFPQQLERLASGLTGPSIEVFNMGISGYNSIQEAELVRTKALSYQPDLLVIGYVLNDNKEDGSDGGLSRYFLRSPSEAYDWLRIRSKRIRRWIGTDVTTEAFVELAETVREQRIPVLILLFPRLELEPDGSYRRAPRHKAVRTLAERLGFMVLDLLEPFKKLGLENAKQNGDRVHPSARGHRVAAEQLLAFLEQKRLLD